MRIMHIIIGLKSHGAELMLQRLIEAAPAAIPNTVVVSLTSLGAIGESLRKQGVEVHVLGMSSGWSAPLALWKLVRLIRQFQPDIVQTWMYHADLLGGLAALLAGHRNIVWGVRQTSLWFSVSPSAFLARMICAFFSGSVPKKIICVAESAKQSHIAVGYRAERMTVINNGFNFSTLVASTDKRQALRRAWNFTDSNVVIGAVGRFHPNKDYVNFVKAAAIVARARPEAMFILVGADCDANNAELRAWITEGGLQDRFVLLGERGDVPDCLAAMDVYCMSSRTEGFPNSLGEAMAMELPCVATIVGDAAALMGDTGVLVPPSDWKALAEGLLSIVRLSREQREQFGRRARIRVTTAFPIEKTRDRYDAVYRKLLAEDKS